MKTRYVILICTLAALAVGKLETAALVAGGF